MKVLELFVHLLEDVDEHGQDDEERPDDLGRVPVRTHVPSAEQICRL